MMIGEIIIVLLVLFLIFGAVYARHVEIKKFNKGICTLCGGKFESFDIDSQGGTGWKCENPKCQNGLWTSWVKIKK